MNPVPILWSRPRRHDSSLASVVLPVPAVPPIRIIGFVLLTNLSNVPS
jgi:hypothetical protein